MRYFIAILAGACLVLVGCSGSGKTPENSGSTAPSAAPVAAPATAADAKPADPKSTGDPGSPPETIEFQSSRDGNVIFTHKKHFDRVSGDCSTCHDKIFTQSREPINYGKALHRAAEAKRTACASCHAIGGTAFAADSNCTKCHLMRQRR